MHRLRRPASSRQPNSELGEIADLAIDGDRAAVLLGHDVVTDRETETGALAGRLGGEERLEELVAQFGGDADAVVADAYFNGVDTVRVGLKFASPPSFWRLVAA